MMIHRESKPHEQSTIFRFSDNNLKRKNKTWYTKKKAKIVVTNKQFSYLNHIGVCGPLGVEGLGGGGGDGNVAFIDNLFNL